MFSCRGRMAAPSGAISITPTKRDIKLRQERYIPPSAGYENGFAIARRICRSYGAWNLCRYVFYRYIAPDGASISGVSCCSSMSHALTSSRNIVSAAKKRGSSQNPTPVAPHPKPGAGFRWGRAAARPLSRPAPRPRRAVSNTSQPRQQSLGAPNQNHIFATLPGATPKTWSPHTNCHFSSITLLSYRHVYLVKAVWNLTLSHRGYLTK
jgi:hypothetical protein